MCHIRGFADKGFGEAVAAQFSDGDVQAVGAQILPFFEGTLEDADAPIGQAEDPFIGKRALKNLPSCMKPFPRSPVPVHWV